MLWRHLLASTLLALSFNAPFNESTAPVEIRGSVITENKTGIPKAHVYTVFGEEETFTDEKGGFILKTSQPFPVKLYVQHNGYRDKALLLTEAGKSIDLVLIAK